MKVLLYSGGVDSWLINQIWKPDKKLYIDVGGAYSDEEIRRMPEDVEIIECHFLGKFEDEATRYIPMRNLFFLMIASNYGDEICLGATSGDYGSIDKRPEFLDKAESYINQLIGKQTNSNGRKIKIEKRFVKMSKFEITAEYLENAGSLDLLHDETFSCFNPINGKQCYGCKPCFRRFMLLYYYGYPFKQKEKDRMFAYIRKSVVPRRKAHGTYYSEKIGEGAKMKIAVRMLYSEYGLSPEDDE